MSVLEGPRRELRRVVVDGRVRECRLDGDRLVLDDGRIDRGSGRGVRAAGRAAHDRRACTSTTARARSSSGVDLERSHPTYFLKPATAINAHRGELVRPADCQLLNYEGEIAAVVGRTMRRVRPDDVWDHLAGFTCANDVGRARLSRHRRRLDAAREGPGRLLPDRARRWSAASTSAARRCART